MTQEALANAVKHSDATKVHVRLVTKPGFVSLAVIDNGRGFDGGAALHGNGHAGVGLLSIKERVELAGGSVNIESAIGRGTRLYVVIPLVHRRAWRGDDMNAAKSREQIKVLLVDDHAILREGVHALLAREPDITVVGEAADGQEAVEQVPRLRPDVVIMDIVMPRMNGLEATRLIKERHPDVRVLILSMYDDHEYVVQIIQAGASGYVLKRVVTEDLVRAIHEVHAGESFLYPPIAATLIGDYLRVTRGESAATPRLAAKRSPHGSARSSGSSPTAAPTRRSRSSSG